MGALSFIIHNNSKSPINISFTEAFMKMQSRGPDDTTYKFEVMPDINRFNSEQIKMYLSKREIAEYKPFTFMSGYHRLAINDITKDACQPFEDPIQHFYLQYPFLKQRPHRQLYCNGEIYNFKEIKTDENFEEYELQSSSDVEVIMPLYIRHGIDNTLQKLNGDYSFILTENLGSFDVKKINIFVVRDILGTKPLYMVKSNNTHEHFYAFVSELKGLPKSMLNDDRYQVTEVPPGSYWSFNNSVVQKSKSDFIRYADFTFYKDLDNCAYTIAQPNVLESIYTEIKNTLQKAVILRTVSCDVPLGVLLSGGFDSCIVLSLLVEYLVCNSHDFVSCPIHAFTIGDIDNIDVRNANKCVEFLENKYKIDIIHHIVSIKNSNLTITDIEKIVLTMETQNPHLINGGIIYNYLCNYIKTNSDVKVLLSGEGLDEMCGYYHMFEKSDIEFQRDSVTMLENLHTRELQRADKIFSSYGLEIRYPFLDKHVIELILSIHPCLKRPQAYGPNTKPIEKFIIRKAFDCPDDCSYLPYEILWNKTQDITYSFLNYLPNSINFDSVYTDTEFLKFKKSQEIQNIQVNNKLDMHILKTYYKNFT
jgi:asparagine synthase (glutamine-hydrolysing)